MIQKHLLANTRNKTNVVSRETRKLNSLSSTSERTYIASAHRERNSQRSKADSAETVSRSPRSLSSTRRKSSSYAKNEKDQHPSKVQSHAVPRSSAEIFSGIRPARFRFSCSGGPHPWTANFLRKLPLTVPSLQLSANFPNTQSSLSLSFSLCVCLLFLCVHYVFVKTPAASVRRGGSRDFGAVRGTRRAAAFPGSAIND